MRAILILMFLAASSASASVSSEVCRASILKGQTGQFKDVKTAKSKLQKNCEVQVSNLYASCISDAEKQHRSGEAFCKKRAETAAHDFVQTILFRAKSKNASVDSALSEIQKERGKK